MSDFKCISCRLFCKLKDIDIHQQVPSNFHFIYNNGVDQNKIESIKPNDHNKLLLNSNYETVITLKINKNDQSVLPQKIQLLLEREDDQQQLKRAYGRLIINISNFYGKEQFTNIIQDMESAHSIAPTFEGSFKIFPGEEVPNDELNEKQPEFKLKSSDWDISDEEIINDNTATTLAEEIEIAKKSQEIYQQKFQQQMDFLFKINNMNAEQFESNDLHKSDELSSSSGVPEVEDPISNQEENQFDNEEAIVCVNDNIQEAMELDHEIKLEEEARRRKSTEINVRSNSDLFVPFKMNPNFLSHKKRQRRVTFHLDDKPLTLNLDDNTPSFRQFNESNIPDYRNSPYRIQIPQYHIQKQDYSTINTKSISAQNSFDKDKQIISMPENNLNNSTQENNLKDENQSEIENNSTLERNLGDENNSTQENNLKDENQSTLENNLKDENQSTLENNLKDENQSTQENNLKDENQSEIENKSAIENQSEIENNLIERNASIEQNNINTIQTDKHTKQQLPPLTIPPAELMTPKELNEITNNDEHSEKSNSSEEEEHDSILTQQEIKQNETNAPKTEKTDSEEETSDSDDVQTHINVSITNSEEESSDAEKTKKSDSQIPKQKDESQELYPFPKFSDVSNQSQLPKDSRIRRHSSSMKVKDLPENIQQKILKEGINANEITFDYEYEYEYEEDITEEQKLLRAQHELEHKREEEKMASNPLYCLTVILKTQWRTLVHPPLLAEDKAFPGQVFPVFATIIHTKMLRHETNEHFYEKCKQIIAQDIAKLPATRADLFITLLSLVLLIRTQRKKYGFEFKRCDGVLKVLQPIIDKVLLNLLQRPLEKASLLIDKFLNTEFDQSKLLKEFYELFRSTVEGLVYGEVINKFFTSRFTEIVESNIANRIISKPENFTFTNGTKWYSFVAALDNDYQILFPTLLELCRIFVMIHAITDNPENCTEIFPNIPPQLISFIVTNFKKDETIKVLPSPRVINKKLQVKSTPKVYEHLETKKTALTMDVVKASFILENWNAINPSEANVKAFSFLRKYIQNKDMF